MKYYSAQELLGRHIRIEGPVKTPIGHRLLVIADDERIDNVERIDLLMLPGELIEAKLTLYMGVSAEHKAMHEEYTADDVSVSFSAIVTEASDHYVS